jgi:hypothetical protein
MATQLTYDNYGAKTPDIRTISIECHYGEWLIYDCYTVIIPSVVVLSVMAPQIF